MVVSELMREKTENAENRGVNHTESARSEIEQGSN